MTELTHGLFLPASDKPIVINQEEERLDMPALKTPSHHLQPEKTQPQKAKKALPSNGKAYATPPKPIKAATTPVGHPSVTAAPCFKRLEHAAPQLLRDIRQTEESLESIGQWLHDIILPGLCTLAIVACAAQVGWTIYSHIQP